MGETFEETTIENMIIKKTGHIPGEWKVVKPATSEENGIMEQRIQLWIYILFSTILNYVFITAMMTIAKFS